MNRSDAMTLQTENCTMIGWNTTISSDNPNNLISREILVLIDSVKSAILLPILYIIGAPSNIINMLVFFKQGLNERINFCLFLLAMVDLTNLTFLLIYSTISNSTPFTDSGKYGVVYRYMINNNLTGFYGLGYASMLISAVIATERCVCVLFPLQAQRCIRTKSFAFILIISMCIVGFMRFAVTAKYRVSCFYEVRSGRMLWQNTVSDYYVQNKEMLDVLDGIFYGFCMSMGCPLVVLITTVITAVKLYQALRWRDHTSSAMSSKEIGVTKMLICLSIEFLILSCPFMILRLLPMFGSEVKHDGHYRNTFLTLVGLAELSSFTSSSVNFFVYYFTGSRFRETLQKLLHWKSPSVPCGTCKT